MEVKSMGERFGRPIVGGEFAEELGEVRALRVNVDLKIMTLNVSAHDRPGYAVAGDFWTDEELPLTFDYAVVDGVGVVTIRQEKAYEGSFTLDHMEAGELNLGLTDAVPVSVVLKMGVGDAKAELTTLNVPELKLKGGVGNSLITLPRRGEMDIKVNGGVGRVVLNSPSDTDAEAVYRVKVNSGVGSTRIKLPERGSVDLTLSSGTGSIDVEAADGAQGPEWHGLDVHSGVGSVKVTMVGSGRFPVRVGTGVGSVTLKVPENLAAAVSFSGGLGDLNMRAAHFQRTGKRQWQTPGYGEATNRADISVKSGVGSVKIVNV